MIFQVPFRTVLESPAAEILLAEYEAECSLPEMGGINPNLSLYEALERGGMKTFAAYSGDRLIGFATVLIYEVPHYSKKVGSTESLFVCRDMRKSGAGFKLMDTVERYAKDNKCVVFFYSAPEGSQLEKLLKLRKTCRHSNTVFLVKL